MSEIYRFLKKSGVFWVGTVNENIPAVRPFGAVMEYKNQLYISTAVGKDVYHQLIKNPNIQITALDLETREWIRITGEAVEAFGYEEKSTMLKEYPILAKRFSSPEDKKFVLFRIQDIKAEICSDQGKKTMNDCVLI